MSLLKSVVGFITKKKNNKSIDKSVSIEYLYALIPLKALLFTNTLYVIVVL